MESLPADIAKMEYERLSKEIETIQEEANQLAKYAILASAAICTVVVTYKELPHHYIPLLRLLPFCAVLIFGLRVFGQYRRMMAISIYLESFFENEILKKEFPLYGWENHLNNHVRKSRSWRKNPAGIVGLFWFGLLAFTCIFIFL